ncbi:unnamed protein product [Coffea canephora]|uniref:Peroxidase n=1 Tax=Coffea canephora TaxID=49390 RepID=A0A068TS57_COFCA|nr:unnamed protein product [Coffea canephora]
MAYLFTCLTIFLAIFLSYSAKVASLQAGFYRKTCPSAEAIVESVVSQAYANDSGIAPALIRLHFHDCFVRGCDASVLLNSVPGNVAEKDGPANFGVQGFELIDEAKAKIEAQCPNTVSCADIIAFAARDGVSRAGGIHYAVPSGRRDGTISRASEAAENLPMATSNVTVLRENFARKRLSLEEMVTLSGAHSIGGSHCSNFVHRLISPTASTGPNQVVSFDPTTPDRLDNHYYKNLEKHKGLLFSDQVLWTTPSTRKMVKNNADHENLWARKFAAAMVRMGSIELLTGTRGEIRKNCHFVN